MRNQETKELALLGTDRRKLDPAKLPPSIANKLKQNGSEESKLLTAITYDSYSGAMGTALSTVDPNLIEPVIIEEQKYVPKEISDIIVEIAAEKKHFMTPLLNEVLDIVIKREEILLPDSCIALLEKITSLNKSLKQKVNAVIGKRGQRIVELFTDFSLDTTTEDVDWATASSKERLQIFKAQREIDPLQSIELLQNDWGTENIKAKSTFLKAITQTLAPSDQNFLSEIYETEFSVLKKARKADLECKKLLLSSMARLGDNSLLSELKGKLSPYLTYKKSKKILGIGLGSKKVAFTSLKDTDEFWDGKHLSQWLGLSTKNLDLAKFDYDPLYWLSEMIEIFPFGFWNGLLDRSYKDTVDYFLTEKQFQVKIGDETEPIFLGALIQNAKTTKDPELLEALALSPYQDAEGITLMSCFNNEQFETYIKHNKIWNELALARAHAVHISTPWSLKFSKEYLTELKNAVSRGECYPDYQFGHAITPKLHDGSLIHFQKITEESQREDWYYTWQSGLSKPIIHRMNITIRLKKLKSKINE